MPVRTDVVVIGAGVIGLSCARELAGAGLAVTVLEATPAVGRGSSALANGGIRAQFTTEVNIAFSRFSIVELETLERTVGGLGLHQTGYLLLTGAEASERMLRDAAGLQRRLGVGTRWLDPSEIASMVPFVRTDGIRGGTFHAHDGFLDPAGLVTALLADARMKGATIVTRVAVTGIEPGFVVRHTDGELRADAVVNAAGTGARAVARLLGSDVPVQPVRRNLAHVMDPSGAGGGPPRDGGGGPPPGGRGGAPPPPADGSSRTPTPTIRPGGTRRSTPPSFRRSRPCSRTGSRRSSICRSTRRTVGRASIRRHRTTTRSWVRIPPYRASSTASGSAGTD
jgi:glycine/D-amino acid oxidase-like deaminating enzyme